MKYMLFCGNDYYPYGGWEDFNGYFESIEQAKNYLKENEPDACCKWAHIVFNDKIVQRATSSNYFGIEKKGWTWIGEE